MSTTSPILAFLSQHQHKAVGVYERTPDVTLADFWREAKIFLQGKYAS